MGDSTRDICADGICDINNYACVKGHVCDITADGERR